MSGRTSVNGRGLNQAGRFTRAQAIAICRDALPTAGRLGVISEIPVRLADLQAVLGGQIVPRASSTESFSASFVVEKISCRAVFEPRLRGVRAVEGLGAPVHSLGDDFTVELPTGSGKRVHLRAAADEIERRLLRLFLPDAQGRRPAHGANPPFGRDNSSSGDRVLFYEYFNGETGEGLGASHQTGWTALVAALIAGRGARP